MHVLPPRLLLLLFSPDSSHQRKYQFDVYNDEHIPKFDDIGFADKIDLVTISEVESSAYRLTLKSHNSAV